MMYGGLFQQTVVDVYIVGNLPPVLTLQYINKQSVKTGLVLPNNFVMKVFRLSDIFGIFGSRRSVHVTADKELIDEDMEL